VVPPDTLELADEKEERREETTLAGPETGIHWGGAAMVSM
jgi:hypothetical protein